MISTNVRFVEFSEYDENSGEQAGMSTSLFKRDGVVVVGRDVRVLHKLLSYSPRIHAACSSSSDRLELNKEPVAKLLF